VSGDPLGPEERQRRELADRRLHRRLEYDRRRRRKRQRILGALAGAACAVVIGGVAYAVMGTHTSGAATHAPETTPAPVSTAPTTTPQASATTTHPASASPAASHAPKATRVHVNTTGSGRPIVYVQAGHEPPGEPGYLAQTGASGGPFGSEEAFNVRLAAALESDLRQVGVDAIHTPALVTPFGGKGAVFISLHFDAVGGSAGIGWAVDQPGRGENYYQGQGFGTASPTPYPDSAAHRSATSVTLAVQQSSLALAHDIASTFAPIYTPAHGAHAYFRGIEPRTGNVRMLYFYGYYRTNAQARVLIECGAAGADNVFLPQTGLIASSINQGIVSYLRSTGQLP
jgi:hypothetical protein